MTSKRTHSKKGQNYKSFDKKLEQLQLNKHALRSGFKKRKAQKITGKALLISFILMAMQGKNTFQHWAEQISNLKGRTVSKQGLWKRITVKLTQFLLAVLFDALGKQTNNIYKQAKQEASLKHYKRVLLQDSTTLSLPDSLSWCFPGNVSKGKKKAQLKIQVVYDLLSNRFVYFEITSYTANDQSKSKDILSIATKGDLVIRDLGYFVLKYFDEMAAQNISFISRLKYGVGIYNMTTGEEINLLEIVRKQCGFDQWVMIGRDQKLKIRLILLQLPQEQANLRRKRAKENRDRRLNHNQEYYEMLDYNLFITTEDENIFTAKHIAQMYGWRWRIESIFKCWKSHFNLQKLIPENCSLTKERTEAIVYMMLIFILLFQVSIYHHMLLVTEKIKNCSISLIKLCQYITHNIELFFTQNLTSLMHKILYYCCYDKRYDRKTFVQKIKLG
jgi:hypothetical protein